MRALIATGRAEALVALLGAGHYGRSREMNCTRTHVLVTGASSGIGRSSALHLAAQGRHVYAGVRNPADGTSLTQSTAGEITPLLLDVTDATQLAAAVDTVTSHVANIGLDGLVNNAGIGVFGPLELIPLEHFRRLLEVNITGQLAVTQAFLPLIRQACGRIVMIGSIGTRFTPPFVGPLAMSKSAIATMDEALRQEVAPWGIRVVLIEPASIRTDAVSKLDSDAAQLMSQASPAQQALYQDARLRPPPGQWPAPWPHHGPGPVTLSASTPGRWRSSLRHFPRRCSTGSAASGRTSPRLDHAQQLREGWAAPISARRLPAALDLSQSAARHDGLPCLPTDRLRVLRAGIGQLADVGDTAVTAR